MLNKIYSYFKFKFLNKGLLISPLPALIRFLNGLNGTDMEQTTRINWFSRILQTLGGWTYSECRSNLPCSGRGNLFKVWHRIVDRPYRRVYYTQVEFDD